MGGGLGGETARQTFKELFHVFGDSLLIAFDGEKGVGPSFLDNNACRFGLGVQRIGRYQGAFDRDAAEQFLGGENFIGAWSH